MREARHTIFIDLDGVCVQHKETLYYIITETPVLLDGVADKFQEWRSKDYYIVLTTARPEGCRAVTVRQLESLGLFWDQLIMGLPVGPRVVINDRKPTGMGTALAVCLKRDEGLINVKI